MDWFCVVLHLTALISPSVANYYTNTWAVHIEGGVENAKRLATKHGFHFLDQIFTDYYHFQHRKVSRRSLLPTDNYHELLRQEFENRGPGLDLNLLPAYEKWHVTGKDVVVSILDDGIEKDHPDLMKNYDENASYDVNGHDPDPQPRYDDRNENRHGTRCAGEIAAQADNSICSVGIAYNAKIGGVRMLDGDVTDAVEAQALSLNPQHIDIYSASWGPDDDGRTVDGPGPLARKAFTDGILMGRRGLGSIFVWASGNGGRDDDSCNCDGYTNSLYTLSISSATENGAVPWYSESCSSTLATTYSSGFMSDRQIVTTDLRKQCTESHTGTSASAPLAAGIAALVLEANPLLTWRDLQHIVVVTSAVANLQADDWVTNGVGRKVSHHFGFGMMDASAMVERAVSWENVPEQHRCEISLTNSTPINIPINGFVEASLTADGCRGTASEVLYLEHVESVVTLSTSVRGQIQLFLTSPAGTRSTLLNRRSHDSSSDGFNGWPFMTTHNWGEDPKGTWVLQARNGDSVATLKNWTLVFYGTVTDPLGQLGEERRHLKPDEAFCGDSEWMLKPFCYKSCPKTYYGTSKVVQITSSSDRNNKAFRNASVCEPCHFTCLRCWGPLNGQCSECISRCHLTYDHRCVELPAESSQGHRSFRTMVLLFVIPIISAFVILVLVLLSIASSKHLCMDPERNAGKGNRVGDKEEQVLLLSETDRH